MTGHAKKLSDLGIVIPNRLGINRVLQSLPPSYKNFVMNYNMQNMNKELPELFGMLKAAEIEIKKEHQVLMVNKTTSFKKQGKSKGKFKKGGKKAATPPVKPKNGPKPDAECYYCKEKGHWKRNCSKYLADLKSGLVKKKKEGMEHWTAVKNILKYLKRTKDMFLCYGGDQELVVNGYTDASWNTDPDDSKSQSGYVFILNGAAVSWASSKQCTVAKSSTESEYIAASEASSEAVWMKRFIVELGVVPSALDPLIIYCDNMGAIANAQEPRSHKRLKHIKLRYHSIREYIEDGEEYTPGLEAMLKEFISTQTAFNKSVEEKLGKIDILASKVDSLAADVDLLKSKVMPNENKDIKSFATANAIQVRINENIRLMAELRARWEKEENAKDDNVAKVWTITTTSNANASHVAAPPTINGKITGVGNVSTFNAKRAKSAETACDKTAKFFSNVGDNDLIALDHNGLDFDDCHISEVIK
ncbi:hypothetical protein QYE76_060015 [Lolium multiflorum]|uniref:CCHC-type domain-containing protein n=1 Tax=Lolium multiflorum TaxID=4521 RepID=A0AAD8S0F3_LOLMU|nr:hypothetical protein QYE76_060015 [Lolium multiflorum]